MNPQIQWRNLANRECLVLTFEGQFTHENATQAIAALEPMFDGAAGQVTMVWECTAMSGYENLAREVWQEFIGRIKPRIESIHLVSQNILIRSGAMVVGMFVGIKIVTWSTIEDLDQHA